MKTDSACRVLVVEDDPGDAHLVRQMLRKGESFDLEGAGSLAEARLQLRQSMFDVILLDMSLPDSSGLDTLTAMQEMAGGLPIIVLTGHDNTELALKTLESGAQDYLVKGSFESDGLVRAIRYAISRARLERRLEASEERDRLLLAALEAVGNAVLVTDTESRIEWVNPAFEKLTGYSRGEVIGYKAAELMKSGVQDKSYYETMWNTILSGRTWRGELVNRRKDGSFQNEELTIAPVKDNYGNIHHFVGIKHDITERKQVEERIRHMAQYDVLTDLPNRALFSDRMSLELAIAKRDKERLAVLFVDFDRFKPINDTLGHEVGDLLLQEAARRMQGCMRASDTLARIGGDEFVVLLRSVEEEADAMLVAEKIRHALNRPFAVAGHSLNISSSTGIAIYPEHGMNEVELMRNADIAMYYAKESGRDCVKIFHPGMREERPMQEEPSRVSQ